MRRPLGQPRVLHLGFNQFVGLLFAINPGAPATVLTALLQTGVPHRPTRVSSLLCQPRLSIGQLDPKASTGLHTPQPNAGHRHLGVQPDRLTMGWRVRRGYAATGTT